MKFIKTICLIAAVVSSMAITNAQNTEIKIHLSDKSVKTITDFDSITLVAPTVVLPISITIDEIHEVWGLYTSSSKDENLTYNVMFVEKDYYDDNYSTDEDVFADDLLYFEELAKGYGMTVAQVIDSYLIYAEDGDFTDWMVELTPNTEYVIWAYGLNNQGEVLTPMTKKVFKTPDVEMINNQITFTLSEDGSLITVTPDDKSLNYICFSAEKSDDATPEMLLKRFQQELSASLYDYLFEGMTVSDALKGVVNKGENDALLGEITAGTYYMVAAYINENGAINSPAFSIEFTATGENESGSVNPLIKALKKDSQVKRHTAKRGMTAR